MTEQQNGISTLTRSMAEQTICAGGQQFDAQSGSTFSGLIDLVRSSSVMMKLHGYLLGEEEKEVEKEEGGGGGGGGGGMDL